MSGCGVCGPGETCNQAAQLCQCGADLAASTGEEACPASSPYSECADDVNGKHCGCEFRTCEGAFECDLGVHECFCTEGGCGADGFCWPQGSGALTGKCFVDESTCGVFGQIVVAGMCTCANPAASCED